MNFIFWRKFSHLLLIGLSALLLFAGVQSGMVGDFTQRGPNQVLADEEDYDQVGPAAAPVCTPNDQVRVEEDCVGDQWCKFNWWIGSTCNEGRGGAYGCQRIAGRCGYNPAPPVQVTTPVVEQVAPPPCSQLVTSTTCGQPSYDTCTLHYESDGRARYDCVASKNHLCVGSLYCAAAAPQAPAAVSLPACPAKGQSGTQEVCPGTWAYDTCTTTQLADGRIKYDCRYSQNSNCVGTVFCPAAVSVSQCTPRLLRRDTECVGSSLCTFNIHQRSDCSIDRRGPFSCFQSSRCGRVGDRGSQGPQGPAGAPGPAGAAGVATTVTVQREVVREVFVGGNVGVAATTVDGQVLAVKELPKTGLPALAWAALAFIPTGFGIKRLGRIKKENESDPDYLWEDRQFKAGS